MSVAFPVSPTQGQQVTDPVTGAAWMWNTNRWVPVATGMGLFVPLAGGAMNGPLALQGIIDGSNPLPGQVGEILAQIVTTPVTLTSGVYANVGSVLLSPGDWDLQAEAWLVVGTGATLSSIQANLSPTSLTPTAAPLVSQSRTVVMMTAVAAQTPVVPVKPCRVIVTAATTYYLVVAVSASGGTCTSTGVIWARRAR